MIKKRTLRPAHAAKVNFMLVLMFATVCFFAAHESTSKPNAGLDVNDVSILFPVGPNGLHPSISLQELGAINEEVFEQALRFEYPVNSPSAPPLADLPYVDSRFITDFARWKVTSFRIEDCGEVIEVHSKIEVNGTPTLLIERAAGCQERLRLVAQPLNLFGIALPTAIHILINLDSAEFRNLITQAKFLQDLSNFHYKTKTTGRSLGLHPGLTAELSFAGNKLLADHVRDMLVSALGRNLNSLTSVASKRLPQTEAVTLILQTEINHWKFTGGLVRDGKWIKFETPFNRQFRLDPAYTAIGVEDLKCDIHSSCKLDPDPSKMRDPLFPAGITLASIFQDDVQFAKEQVPGLRSNKTLETAELVDLPSTTHFFNTSCVSCHESSNLRDPNRRHVSQFMPKGLTPFVEKIYSSQFTNNVLNFGYFGASPKVSTRTAAESLEVANRINQMQNWENPARDIIDLEKFWNCVRTENDSKKCYENL